MPEDVNKPGPVEKTGDQPEEDYGEPVQPDEDHGDPDEP